jgi:hypothetical protein
MKIGLKLVKRYTVYEYVKGVSKIIQKCVGVVEKEFQSETTAFIQAM